MEIIEIFKINFILDLDHIKTYMTSELRKKKLYIKCFITISDPHLNIYKLPSGLTFFYFNPHSADIN